MPQEASTSIYTEAHKEHNGVVGLRQPYTVSLAVKTHTGEAERLPLWGCLIGRLPLDVHGVKRTP